MREDGTISLKFGTSGLRGLASDLKGEATARYTGAFVRHLRERGALAAGGAVFVARDLRDSSPAIAETAAAAIAAEGLAVVDCGAVPTPALALAAMAAGAPALMVTGSHIPADRNGLKFYRPDGEIDKDDEAAIAALAAGGASPMPGACPPPRRHDAVPAYAARAPALVGPQGLSGLTVGVYEHSSVCREILADTLQRLGARIVRLGRSERFVSVDTEAVDAQTCARLEAWAAEHALDAIVSTDGDGDRPLLSDEAGIPLRGDLVGLATALFVEADRVVTPVTSNSGIGAGLGLAVTRTRVGSPHVIAGMQAARRDGTRRVVGFEANGGTLLGCDIAGPFGTVSALPTRDSLLPIVAVLATARRIDTPLSALSARWSLPATASDRLADYPPSASAALLARLAEGRQAAGAWLEGIGAVEAVDLVDGARIRLTDGRIVHFRASGNAPELRCYAEAGDPAAAGALVAAGLERAAAFLRNQQGGTA